MLASELLPDQQNLVDLDRKVLGNFNTGKKLTLFCLTGLITLVLSSFKIMGLSLTLQNCHGAFTLSPLLKLLSRKLEP